MKYRIKELRESAGMSQSQLSKASGVARATIWRLETGEDEITTTKTLTKIAEALRVPVDELFLAAEV